MGLFLCHASAFLNARGRIKGDFGMPRALAHPSMDANNRGRVLN
jgi:hypothetical protein